MDPKTFEALDKHFSQVNLAPYKKKGVKSFTFVEAKANPSGVLEKICSIYKLIRPFLLAVTTIIIIPTKWRDALKVFMALLDSLCPAS